MNANELRIGNIVASDNGGEFVILEVSKEAMKSDFYGSIGYHDEDFFKPIPLTEEWLLKFGFLSNPYQDRYEKDGIHIECDKIMNNELNLWIEKLPKFVRLKYVHQLQNLYFALTGEELCTQQ